MYKNISKTVLLSAAALVLAFSGAITAQAASKVAVDLPNAPVAGGETVPLPIALTGFTYTDLTVTLLADSGTLTVNDDAAVLTLNPGYSSLADQTEVSFHGATADVVTAMAEKITWTAPGDASTSTELGLKVQVGEFEEGVTYDPATGHTYKYVTTALSWADAATAANGMTYKGKSGYLAVITTDEENTFVANKSGAASVWFGATMDQTLVAAILTAAGKSAYVGDPQTAGAMHWAGGVEAGINFSTGLAGAMVPVGENYNHWASGEPNNYRGGEACGVTNWSGTLGNWNDLPCSGTHSYLVEFDTSPDQFTTSFVTFDNITGDDTDAVPAAEESSAALADTGYNAALLLALALALVAAGTGFTYYSRRK